MKTRTLLFSALLASSITFAGCKKQEKPIEIETSPTTTQENSTTASSENKIQLAILLDTSNSMDGLIEQAKSRLWNIVNTLTSLKYHGKTPEIEIGLYEYGNDGLSSHSNYIRKVAPLSTDLDLISEKLFALKTNGGSEYCGAVIQDAVNQLEWHAGKNNMKLIYIASNESFNQGGVDYLNSTKNAIKQNIFVNTIFCGDYSEGISTFWQDGAYSGKGRYFNIDSDQKVRFIATPYDDKISECNKRINNTYVSYGKYGRSKKENQMKQDANAGSISRSNYIERSVSKSKKAYKNTTWDLVDKIEEDSEIVEKLETEALPQELKNKSKEEIKKYVTKKAEERKEYQKQIADLAKKRQAYIDQELKKQDISDDLGSAINSSIIALGESLGYTFE